MNDKTVSNEAILTVRYPGRFLSRCSILLFAMNRTAGPEEGGGSITAPSNPYLVISPLCRGMVKMR